LNGANATAALCMHRRLAHRKISPSMPNHYFEFKQFSVQQEFCAMKVCTDACLFGAWVAQKMASENVASSLDVGAGTGLLSLMLAQKLDRALINAIEIDEAASKQANENFENSLWKKRLHLSHCAAQNFVSETQFDLIISNPPFFENALKSDDAKRNIALHENGLALDELIKIANKFLKDDGKFAVLLPHLRTNYFEKLASENGFYLKERLLVKQSPKHTCFRSILLFQKKYVEFIKEGSIEIKNAENEYSSAFIALLKDYYLHL
jgi:tRNA1Val (adenine37-N6)-methyltransferase